LLLAVLCGPADAAPTPEQIKAVAADMVCLCGSCNRESLATCLCGAFAVPERESIGRMLEAGSTPEEIVATYVGRFGSMVLANPPEGYDAVWIIPFGVLAAGVLGVRQILVRWRRGHPGSVSAEPVPVGPGKPASSPLDERLRRDLDNFDS
jgi:cytochrome c-type biogenesis protein CcmH/NrfF